VVEGAREAHLFRERPLYILGREAQLIITRPGGFAPQLKEFVLEAGMAPMPGAGALVVVLTDPQGVSHEFTVSGPTPVAFPLRLAPGSNVCTLVARATSGHDAPGGLLLLQTLSLELPGATTR
jgi:hypothetical protein